MKPLTNEENALALDQLMAGERLGLARLRYQIHVQRDVLNAPADQIAQLEAAAIKSVAAIEWMEGQRAKAMEHTNGLTVGAV